MGIAEYFNCGGQEAEDIPGGDGRKKGRSGTSRADYSPCEGSERWKNMIFEDVYTRLRYKIEHWRRSKESFLHSKANVTELCGRGG